MLRIRLQPCFDGIPLQLGSTPSPQRLVLPVRTVDVLKDSLLSNRQESSSQDALSPPLLQTTAQHTLPADTIVVTALRFYCSAWILSACNVSTAEQFFNEHLVRTRSAHVQLVDAADSASCIITAVLPDSASRRTVSQCLWLRLGVDSLTNTLGALGGDLDPMRGMYWAWQSGYINFKLEGTSTRCTARHRKFQFHLGGYLSPFESAQILRFDIPKFSEQQEQQELVLTIDIKKFLEVIDLATLHSVMSPSREAVRLSRQAARAFTLRAPTQQSNSR